MALAREGGRVQEGESLWPHRVGESIWTSCAQQAGSQQDARTALHRPLGNHPIPSHETRGLTLQYPCRGKGRCTLRYLFWLPFNES